MENIGGSPDLRATVPAMSPWSPDSWREREALQQPTYPDGDAVHAALTELGRLPPLVTSWEIESLRERLATVARGDACQSVQKR